MFNVILLNISEVEIGDVAILSLRLKQEKRQIPSNQIHALYLIHVVFDELTDFLSVVRVYHGYSDAVIQRPIHLVHQFVEWAILTHIRQPQYNVSTLYGYMIVLYQIVSHQFPYLLFYFNTIHKLS